MNDKVRYGEEPGDNLFRDDAARLGYLKEDPHEPGLGRRLWAYYHDHGMLAPEEVRKEIPAHELTTLERLGQSDPLLAVDIEGLPDPDYGRHTKGAPTE